MLDLSAHIEPRRDRYYAALLAVSRDGDWPGWYDFMLEVFEEQARDAAGRARRLQDLRDDYRLRVATSRSSGLLPDLVDALFHVPALTIARARQVLGVTHRAAAQNVERLVDAGIVQAVPGHLRPKLFIATEVVSAVEGRPPPRRLQDDPS